VAPFGLLDADDDGRCRAVSTVACTNEFCRARDDTGRLFPEGGPGEVVLGSFSGSGKLPMTGDDVTDGDMAFPVRLRIC
jgi:hypothetical protein